MAGLLRSDPYPHVAVVSLAGSVYPGAPATVIGLVTAIPERRCT